MSLEPSGRDAERRMDGVTDRSNGLRFDIYERVHLPDDVAAIDELEEIELVPRMQVLNQADQLLLKGHLLLTGVYRSSERGDESAKLEHWIPVEISLPPSRVQNVGDLAVEIDNFDVDLLSTRSLNVTGVLALRGLQAEPPQPAIWRDDSFTVVHQARSEPDDDPEAAYPGIAKAIAQSGSEAKDAAFGGQVNHTEEQTAWGAAGEADGHEAWASAIQPDLPVQAGFPMAMGISAEQAEQPAQPKDRVEQFEQPLQTEERTEQAGSAPSSVTDWGDISGRNPVGAIDQEHPAAESAAQDAKPEVKIALGAKPAEPSSASGVDWQSLIGDKRSLGAPELQTDSADDAQPAGEQSDKAPATTGDELEWTRLFLSAEADTESLYKVRMCIVQREDTIEGIAARYNVQPRELQLRNQLHEPYVSEGQVLYIP